MLVVPLIAISAVLLLAGAAASRSGRAPGAGIAPAGPRAVTPLFSLRRVPEPLVVVVRSTKLSDALKKVTDAVEKSACLAVAVGGRFVVQDNASTPYLPGSNEKIITAAVALDVLGDDFRYTTSVRGRVKSDGSVSRMVLVGGGDPLLSTDRYPRLGLNKYPPIDITRIEKLADDVVAAGVRRVDSLVADASRYDRKTDAPGWVNAIGRGDASPLSALMINDGYIGTGSTRRASSAQGGVEVFRDLLVARGVSVGRATEGKGSDDPVIASIESVPMSTVVREMLTTSDNNTAELVLKEIGRKVSDSGSTAAGAKALKASLKAWGIDTTGHVFADGSGLSEDDRISCSTLVRVLARGGDEGAMFMGMSIAGQTGTLKSSLKGTPGEGVLRAKTGTLKKTRALSGFFPTKNGETIQFSFIVNGDRAKVRAESLWDDLVRGFATYPSGAAPSDLGPLPVELS